MRSQSWQTLIEQFMAEQRGRGLSVGTMKHRRYYVGEFADQAPADPWAVTASDVDRFGALPRWSQESGRIMRQALRAFFAWAYAAGHLSEDLSPPREGVDRQLPAAWHVAMKEYLTEAVSRGLSPETIRLRRICLCTVAQALPDPWVVTTSDLREYLATHPHWKPETRKNVRSTLRSFYSWADEEDYVKVDPSARLKSVRIPPGVPRPAQDEDVVAAIETAEPRTALMMGLARYAGLRSAEIAKVNLRDIDGDVLRVTGKGGVTREIPLVPGLREALHTKYAAAGWVFSNGNGGHLKAGSVSRLVSAALPDGVTCHMLRHRFASDAFAGSRDLLTVSKLLGHSRPETTQRYVRLPDDALRSVVGHVGDYNPRTS